LSYVILDKLENSCAIVPLGNSRACLSRITTQEQWVFTKFYFQEIRTWLVNSVYLVSASFDPF